MTTLRKELRTEFEKYVDPSLAETMADAALELAGIKSAAQRREEAERRIAEQRKGKGDIVDLFVKTQPELKARTEALLEFEKSFGYGTLPWDTTAVWEKFAKFVIKTSVSDPGWCADYVVWREGDGKYKAFSNRKIRENPQAFIDTGYPEYDASKMYREEPKPVIFRYDPKDDEKYVPPPETKPRIVR